jgi:hypothetical protein
MYGAHFFIFIPIIKIIPMMKPNSSIAEADIPLKDSRLPRDSVSQLNGIPPIKNVSIMNIYGETSAKTIGIKNIININIAIIY